MNEHKGRVKFALIILAAVLLCGLAVLTQPTSGNHVQPVYVGYDAGCADLAPPDVIWNELRIAPVQDGTYSNQWLTVTLDVHEGNDDDDDLGSPTDPDGDDDDESTTIDWTANGGVDGVFVKGGPGGHFYGYAPPASNDWRLTAPPKDDDDYDDDRDGDDGDDDEGYYDPAHILFCVAGPLPTPTPPQSSTATPTPSPTATRGPGTPPPEPTSTPGPFNRRVFLPSVCSDCSAEPGEPNNTCAAAHAIQVNATYEFFANDRHDWYRFQISAAPELAIRVDNFVPLDGQVAAYAGATCETATFLGSNGDSASQKTLTLGPQPAGTYYIYVSNDGVPNGADPYRLIVEVR